MPFYLCSIFQYSSKEAKKKRSWQPSLILLKTGQAKGDIYLTSSLVKHCAFVTDKGLIIFGKLIRFDWELL